MVQSPRLHLSAYFAFSPKNNRHSGERSIKLPDWAKEELPDVMSCVKTMFHNTEGLTIRSHMDNLYESFKKRVSECKDFKSCESDTIKELWERYSISILWKLQETRMLDCAGSGPLGKLPKEMKEQYVACDLNDKIIRSNLFEMMQSRRLLNDQKRIIDNLRAVHNKLRTRINKKLTTRTLNYDDIQCLTQDIGEILNNATSLGENLSEKAGKDIYKYAQFEKSINECLKQYHSHLESTEEDQQYPLQIRMTGESQFKLHFDQTVMFEKHIKLDIEKKIIGLFAKIRDQKFSRGASFADIENNLRKQVFSELEEKCESLGLSSYLTSKKSELEDHFTSYIDKLFKKNRDQIYTLAVQSVYIMPSVQIFMNEDVWLGNKVAAQVITKMEEVKYSKEFILFADCMESYGKVINSYFAFYKAVRDDIKAIRIEVNKDEDREHFEAIVQKKINQGIDNSMETHKAKVIGEVPEWFKEFFYETTMFKF